MKKMIKGIKWKIKTDLIHLCVIPFFDAEEDEIVFEEVE